MATQCARGAYDITRDAGFTGVEAHLFMPFTTIRQRVQIGVELAGGIAKIEGTSDRFVRAPRNQRPVGHDGDRDSWRAAVQASLQDLPQDWPIIPIGRVALAVGVIVRPGVKLRASGGVNFPGYYYVALHAQYLFGAR